MTRSKPKSYLKYGIIMAVILFSMLHLYELDSFKNKTDRLEERIKYLNANRLAIEILNYELKALKSENEKLKEEIRNLQESETVKPIRNSVADIQLGKGFSKELAKAKEVKSNAVLLKLVSTSGSYAGISKAFKSDVLDSKELNEFLEARGVMVVKVDYPNDKRFGGASTARQVWNTGNCVGMVLMDLDGKVLHKLPEYIHTGPFGKKTVFILSDIIRVYDKLVPADIEGID